MIALAGCRPAEDSSVPDIYWKAPANGATFHTGDTIWLDWTLVDDRQMERYTWQIFAGFDTLTLPAAIIEPYSQLSSAAISGNTIFVQDTLQLPDSIAAGTYIVSLAATDAGGNTNTMQRRLTFTIRADEQLPQWDTLWVQDSVKVGEALTIFGIPSDSTALGYVGMALEEDDKERLRWQQPLSGQRDTLQQQMTLNVSPGLYQLRVLLGDWANNTREQSLIVLVYE